MISTFEEGIKQTPFSPALLWKTVRDYHVSNSESVKLMLRSNITSFNQGPTRDLLEHIEEFRAKIDAFLGANGKMDEEEQARQLVTSLNQEWSDKGCFFLDAGYITFSKLETELKKSYQTRKMRTSSSINQSSRAADTSEANQGRRFGRWQTCNKTRCLGQDHPTKPHHPTDCYHNPDNVGKMEEWKRAKQQSGEWIEYPRGGQRGRGRGQSSNVSRGHWVQSSSNFPRSDELQSAFANMKLEDRHVGYHANLHGKFSCSAEPQLASHGDQCSRVGLMDTGASHFMFHDKSLFDTGSLVANVDPDAKLNLAGGGATLDIHSIGSVTLENSKGETETYHDCLYVPKLSRNLIAGGRLLRAGATTTILKDPYFRIDRGGKELFVGQFVGEGSLMYVPIKPAVSRLSPETLTSETNQLTILKLHYSLGHPSEEYMRRMLRLGMLKDILPDTIKSEDLSIVSKCPICPLAKNTQLPFSSTRPRARTF